MIESGLEDEVRGLIAKGYSRHLNALNSVGYKEIFDFIGGIHGRAEMIDLIKRNSRRFAKRQMTWFRRDARIQWIPVTGDDWEKKTTRNFVEALSMRPRLRR
jgi:tRNA dimethylallyltransferase